MIVRQVVSMASIAALLVLAQPLVAQAGAPESPTPTPTTTATPSPVPTECSGFPFCQCDDVLPEQQCGFGLCPSGSECVSIGTRCGCEVVPTPTATPTPPAELRHFQCYGVRRQSSAGAETLTLDDQLGTTTAAASRITRLCNPASKNTEDPDAVADSRHLMGFKIARSAPRLQRVRDIEVTNQFGTITLDVTRPAVLLVPTAKSLSGPVAVPGDPVLDHFECYNVRNARQRASVTVQDQFGGLAIDIKRPKWLCNPVDKNDEGIRDPDGHLLCYSVRSKPSAIDFTGTIWFANQLRSGTIEAQRRDATRPTEICVPSTTRLPPPLTCNDGSLDPGEDCDPPGEFCRGSCNPILGICIDFICESDCSCPPARCGDLSFDPPTEECDDGNVVSGDGCSADCLLEGSLCGGSPGPAVCPSGEFCEFARGTCGPGDLFGICRTIPIPCICPTVLDPVCGCDRQNYDNACLAGCAGTSIFTGGACPP